MFYESKIITNRLYLRCLNAADCSTAYLQWLNNERVNQYLETRFTEQTIDKIQDFVLSVNCSKDSYLFGIFTKHNDTHIGNIKIGPIHPIYKFADVSYFIGDTDSWGKGYASEAIAAVTEFAFNQLKLSRVQAGVHSSNKGSINALEKCGFVREAELRKKIYHGMNPDTEWDDHLYYGMIRDDFTAKKQ